MQLECNKIWIHINRIRYWDDKVIVQCNCICRQSIAILYNLLFLIQSQNYIFYPHEIQDYCTKNIELGLNTHISSYFTMYNCTSLRLEVFLGISSVY